MVLIATNRWMVGSFPDRRGPWRHGQALSAPCSVRAWLERRHETEVPAGSGFGSGDPQVDFLGRSGGSETDSTVSLRDTFLRDINGFVKGSAD